MMEVLDLEQAQARLEALDQERTVLLRQIAAMRSAAGGPDISTAEGRVALFQSLFRGRPDVFATRWESTKTPGRSGWAPRCSNEWRPGVCHKPKVKCADCSSRRFVALTSGELRRHLEGRQTVGIYPLQADETCWLVAVDLDGNSWREDVAALRDSAEDLGIPLLVERSRSGDGAHAWVLFSEPVSAHVARSVGSLLLTRTMTHRAIAMSSYDRLFPNQDTMPAGGFGNLIALPLQRDRRGHGCTVFLDEGLEPYHDQWVYLAGVERLPANRAVQIAGEAERAGGVLGLRPTMQGAAQTLVLSPGAPAPTEVEVRLDARVQIPLAGLPGELRDRLVRTAAFANPAFYERERARLSTHNTPRVISCHEQLADQILLPRGCLDRLVDELGDYGIAAKVDDARSEGDEVSVAFTGVLTDVQQAAVTALAKHDIGVLVAPPGAGKTVVATALIAARARSTLILVHRRPLLEQWLSRLSEFLDIEPGSVGTSVDKPGTSGIDVLMMQSLARREPSDLARYGHVIIDECHHVAAFTAERVLRELPARRVTGLTATPERRDGHHPIINMQCGPVRHTITATSQVETAVRRVLLAREPPFDVTVLPPEPGIQEVLTAVAGDRSRTEQVAADVFAELAEGRYPLVLTERRDHLNALAELIAADTDRVAVLHGGIGKRARRRVDELLASPEPRVLLATGRYIGEGFDDPRLDTLMLAMPIAWKGTMTQYAGRLHRHHDAKHEVRIIDYVDHAVPVLRRMFAKRQKAYAALGYAPG
jgi:superfamily II DNA or RNA helicase